MRVLFKQSVHLCGRDYALGSHDVSDAVMRHPFFQKLVNAGLILDAEEAKIISPIPVQERQKALSDKLATLKAESAPPVSMVSESQPLASLEPSVDAAGEDESASQAPESTPAAEPQPEPIAETMADAIADVMEPEASAAPKETPGKKQKKQKR